MSAGSPVIQTNLRASKVKMISKPTNQEAARRKQSGEVREKENRCLSLSLSFFLLLFHFTRLLNTQSALHPEKSFLLHIPISLGKEGRGGVV